MKKMDTGVQKLDTGGQSGMKKLDTKMQSVHATMNTGMTLQTEVNDEMFYEPERNVKGANSTPVRVLINHQEAPPQRGNASPSPRKRWSMTRGGCR
jgi:hypothetical protein